MPDSVLRCGWDEYYSNWLLEADHRASGSSEWLDAHYYVAALSKGKFYAAYEAMVNKKHYWRLFYFQSGNWRPLGPGVKRDKAGWPTDWELVGMGAGEIPERVWTSLRCCPRIPLRVVTM